METREVSDKLPIVHVPRIFRALGYYPSELEVLNLTNEVKFSKYLETKEHVDEIDFDTMVRLFVNHRPAQPLTLDAIEGAFAALTAGSGELPTDALLDVLQNSGELMSESELAKHLGTLIYGTGVKDVLGPNATAQSFSSEVLGF